MAHPSYADIVRDSERARWSLDEVTADLVDLDFDRPFLPTGMVRAGRLPFLLPHERTVLSQIRARAYLGLSELAERVALPFVMAQAARWLQGDAIPLLALMGYGQQVAKHIALFDRFADAFARGFGTTCEVVGSLDDLNARILTNDMLAVGLLVQHLTCLTQPHWVRGARGCTDLEPRFKELLRVHWREEAQNAKLGAMVLGELAAQASLHERSRAVQQYCDTLGELAVVFREQVELDLATFERVARPLTDEQRDEWRREQARSYDEVYLYEGVTHPTVRTTITAHFGGPHPKLDETSERFRPVP